MAELRIREAVRALVVDPLDRVLLVRFEFPAGTRWALPGGGIDAGESHAGALRRELAEELGLADPVIGVHLWNRLHIIPFINGEFDGQREAIYTVAVAAGFAPEPGFSWEQLNAEHVYELRWWTLAELEASDVVTAPSALRVLLRDFLQNGPPETPMDIAP
jgi:8-oxo-dGTP pyrophosphatase MutT (NUDIX family)